MGAAELDGQFGKKTSFQYGSDYQKTQLQKYINRATNHWQYRERKIDEMLDKFILSANSPSDRKKIVVVDIGCSIGTFAIKFAKMGFSSYGIDLDRNAIELAKELSQAENVEAHFLCADVSDMSIELPRADIAICADIFEHLHDDEIGALLHSLKKRLAPGGKIIFHTFPTQYDYIMFGRKLLSLPLIVFAPFPSAMFARITRAYAAIIDALLLLMKNKTYAEKIKSYSHCNPLTDARLRDIFVRSGLEIKFMESAQLYKFSFFREKIFRKHAIAHRNIYGIAVNPE